MKDIWVQHAEELAKVVGWPKWEYKGLMKRLQVCPTGWLVWWHVEETNTWNFDHVVSNHEAACIWRDWVGRKLAERDIRFAYGAPDAEMIEFALKEKS